MALVGLQAERILEVVWIAPREWKENYGTNKTTGVENSCDGADFVAVIPCNLFPVTIRIHYS
jgi:hypothetical protein